MTIHYFNPDHDIALALNQKRYSPPHAGRQLHSDLGYIPALWAEDNDIVVVEDIDRAEELYNRLRVTNKPRVEFLTLEQLHHVWDEGDIEPALAPWGWNLCMRQKFADAEVPNYLLPTPKDMDIIRELSNRKLATIMLAELRKIPGTTGESIVCTTARQVNLSINNYGDAVIKAPWSSSGRGIRYADSGNTLNDIANENLQRWIQNTLRQQKTIIVERKCNKIIDFAMEFSALPNGKVKYAGLSLFSTINGAYTGNMLVSEAEKRELLYRHISPSLLKEVRVSTEKFLTEHINKAYIGPLGVDMMVCEEGLNPCVEINLRRTMGHVALTLSKQGQRGTMSIKYDGKTYKLSIHD